MITEDHNEVEAERLLEEAEELVEEAEAILDEIIDLEECAREGRKPPRAKAYRLKVNDKPFVWEHATISGLQVLDLAKLLPAKDYRLRLKIKGGKPEPIHLDTIVDLRRPGVEKFRAIKNGQSEGESMGRREAPALDQDEAFLNQYGLPWEVVVDGSIWVLLHNYPLPAGFTESRITLAVRIEGGYPLAALDMMYVFPAVQRVDGRAIPQADVMQMIDGQNFQRWSRHRTDVNPWVPGEDSLETHIYLVEEFFAAELLR